MMSTSPLVLCLWCYVVCAACGILAEAGFIENFGCMGKTIGMVTREGDDVVCLGEMNQRKTADVDGVGYRQTNIHISVFPRRMSQRPLVSPHVPPNPWWAYTGEYNPLSKVL
eukprot:GHVQ01000244.1.p2 GENE.GHVQ01000244.1~~GHVQ01000244.1.p2  ORF type:complete len:112 (-),score=18.74 GHVQ01000244.1:873-1208(-)